MKYTCKYASMHNFLLLEKNQVFSDNVCYEFLTFSIYRYVCDLIVI